MTKIELVRRFEEMGIPQSSYSINDGLIIDGYILRKDDGLWKLFYCDEKGNQTDISWYKNSEDAYLGLIEQFEEDLEVSKNQDKKFK